MALKENIIIVVTQNSYDILTGMNGNCGIPGELGHAVKGECLPCPPRRARGVPRWLPRHPEGQGDGVARGEWEGRGDGAGWGDGTWRGLVSIVSS